ncbi:MAG: MFS transporter [Actinomycetota bacterium]|nr:MFS transporter [Actinomycetota bacterium]
MRARIFDEANRKWWTLGAVCFALFMIMLDNTVVNVALPAIKRDLGLSLTSLEWTVAGYALVFAVLMLTGGKLADMLGRRKIFMLGLAIFTLSSLACGLADSAGTLIAARGVQGAGAALMAPATLSIITATFAAHERGLAIGMWAGVSAVALAVGPLVGGLITEHVSWHWIFYVNVPIGLVGLVVTRLVVPESRDTSKEQRLDLWGLVSSSVGLLALVYALIKGNHYGWASPLILGLFAFAAVALAVFVVLERRQRVPMLDLSLFRSGTFAGANVVAILVTLAMFGVFFFLPIYMQSFLGWSPVEAGAAFLPWTILIVVLAPVAGRLSDRVGSRWLVTAGMTTVAASCFSLSTLELESSYWDVLPGFVLGGLGMSFVMTPMSAAVMGAVPVAKSGVGSAVLNTFRQVGAALGIALTGAILAHRATDAARDGASADEAFVHGLTSALRVSGVIALASAAVAAVFIRRYRHVEADERPALAEAA